MHQHVQLFITIRRQRFVLNDDEKRQAAMRTDDVTRRRFVYSAQATPRAVTEMNTDLFFKVSPLL